MEWSKLKNSIILILLLANLFLLVMVFVQEYGSARDYEEALENTVGVLERSGIRIDPSVIPEEMDVAPLVVERDQQPEAELAVAVLGQCTVTDLGSGRYAYENDLGMAEFRSNGSFRFELEGNAWSAEQAEKETLAALAEVDLTCVVVSREEVDGRVILTLRQTWQDLPVYSCQFNLEYEDGFLRSMVGQRLMGTPQEGNDKREPLSVSTALLRILNGIGDLGDICSEITGMEPGYLLNTSAEATQLIPVWYVTTDTGAYILNALTGVLERAS